MQYAFTDFLSASLVPELGADIAAGAACDIHFILIGISAFRTRPDQLSVILANFNFSIPTAYLTVVALSVQLGIHNIVIYELHYFKYGIQIMLHIRNLYIADGTTG